MSNPDFVEHIIEGRESWKLGLSGFWFRLRGIFTQIAIGLLTGGIFVWFDIAKKWRDDSVTVSLLAVVGGAIILITIVTSVVLVIVRYQSIRSLRIKWQFHEIAHLLRDKMSSAARFASENKKSHSKVSGPDSFRSICNETCNVIRDFFRVFTKDDTVEVGIRIADKINRDPQSQEVCYCTAGRSNGLSSGRDTTSEEIRATEGVPRFFLREKGCRGVLIFHDIKKAIEQGIYKETKNDKAYGHEIATILMAPINGWTGRNTDMIGLLYLTSRNDPFRPKHVDSVKAFADILGITIPRIVDQYLDKRRKQRSGGGNPQ